MELVQCIFPVGRPQLVLIILIMASVTVVVPQGKRKHEDKNNSNMTKHGRKLYKAPNGTRHGRSSQNLHVQPVVVEPDPEPVKNDESDTSSNYPSVIRIPIREISDFLSSDPNDFEVDKEGGSVSSEDDLNNKEGIPIHDKTNPYEEVEVSEEVQFPQDQHLTIIHITNIDRHTTIIKTSGSNESAPLANDFIGPLTDVKGDLGSTNQTPPQNDAQVLDQVPPQKNEQVVTDQTPFQTTAQVPNQILVQEDPQVPGTPTPIQKDAQVPNQTPLLQDSTVPDQMPLQNDVQVPEKKPVQKDAQLPSSTEGPQSNSPTPVVESVQIETSGKTEITGTQENPNPPTTEQTKIEELKETEGTIKSSSEPDNPSKVEVSTPRDTLATPVTEGEQLKKEDDDEKVTKPLQRGDLRKMNGRTFDPENVGEGTDQKQSNAQKTPKEKGPRRNMTRPSKYKYLEPDEVNRTNNKPAQLMQQDPTSVPSDDFSPYQSPSGSNHKNRTSPKQSSSKYNFSSQDTYKYEYLGSIQSTSDTPTITMGPLFPDNKEPSPTAEPNSPTAMPIIEVKPTIEEPTSAVKPNYEEPAPEVKPNLQEPVSEVKPNFQEPIPTQQTILEGSPSTEKPLSETSSSPPSQDDEETENENCKKRRNKNKESKGASKPTEVTGPPSTNEDSKLLLQEKNMEESATSSTTSSPPMMETTSKKPEVTGRTRKNRGGRDDIPLDYY